MPRSSADQPKSAGHTDVYWRRRVIALAAGIGLLALVTWTVNGALGGGGTRQASNLSQTTSQHSGHPATPAASVTPGAPAGRASGTPSPAGTPARSSSAKHGAAATRHPAGQRGRKSPARAAAACPRAGLVLSLFSARYSYPAHARPEFSIDVVSTTPGRCTVNLGVKNLHIVIRAGGKKQVWDSAACTRPAPRATTLARGVPAVVQITWNRQASATGCQGPRRAARPGTYTATAYSGKLGSGTRIFVLKGHGIAVP
ncbi:MAG TPA: hypothetical protein VIF35_01405 [Streptosporangiaceae bacterium]|jgi:hypothetical protein